MKSAQQKFNEYLDECRETSDAVSEFVETSYDNYKSYSQAAGALESMVKDLISELPKARRAEIRERFRKMARDQQNEITFKQIKESA
jgi:chemotaxis protein histidine kinase CheA